MCECACVQRGQPPCTRPSGTCQAMRPRSLSSSLLFLPLSLSPQNCPHFTPIEKFDFFYETRQSYGRTALLLSGGASLGMFHLGVCKVTGLSVHTHIHTLAHYFHILTFTLKNIFTPSLTHPHPHSSLSFSFLSLTSHRRRFLSRTSFPESSQGRVRGRSSRGSLGLSKTKRCPSFGRLDEQIDDLLHTDTDTHPYLFPNVNSHKHLIPLSLYLHIFRTISLCVSSNPYHISIPSPPSYLHLPPHLRKGRSISALSRGVRRDSYGVACSVCSMTASCWMCGCLRRRVGRTSETLPFGLTYFLCVHLCVCM